jgi:2-dehydropantoate 2-reductase
VRFVVLGAGAVGGVVGAQLARNGHDVLLVARGPHLETIRRDGLRLDTPAGNATLRIPAVAHPGEAALDEGDVVLLAVKSQDTVGALDAVRAGGGDHLPVVCFQNGIDNERQALRRFRQVYGVCVMLPALHIEPGVVEASSWPVVGILDVGRYPAGVDSTAEAIAAALTSSGFSSSAIPDVMRWKWAKLVMNLGNAAQALCGDDPGVLDLVTQARREANACFRAAAVDAATQEEDRGRRGDLLTMAPIGGRDRPGGSTWQSLARGAPSLETDHLNGEIVLLGRLHGVPTPANELLQQRAARAAREGTAPGSVDPAELLAELEPPSS